MTGTELTNRLLSRLGEDPNAPRFFRAADALACLNEAQQLFVLLTLCLEAETALTVSAGVWQQDAASTAGDWLVCLAIRTAAGAKVKPATLGDFAARNQSWQAATGTPTRYAVAGFSTLFWDQTASATLTATYARGPAALTADGAAEIPDEYQPVLLDYAQVRMRMNQGAQLLAADAGLLGKFTDAVTKCAAYVRERSNDLRYDAVPPELKMPDWSRVVKAVKPAKGASAG